MNGRLAQNEVKNYQSKLILIGNMSALMSTHAMQTTAVQSQGAFDNTLVIHIHSQSFVPVISHGQKSLNSS